MNPLGNALRSITDIQAISFDDTGATAALDVSMVSPASIFWPEIHRSSDWSDLFTFTKDYFILYSTDHDPDFTNGGEIWWGEFDSFSETGFNGFIERGLIKGGFQAETPRLRRIPTSVSGLQNDTAFLFYHTVGSEPGNDGAQQTRLMTTTGGVLHTATWTDRGRPLGLLEDESHTGYINPFIRPDGNWFAHHLFDTFDYVGGRVSVTSNPISWERLLTFDGTEGMPKGNTFHRCSIVPFTRNGKLYGIIQVRGDKAGIAIVKVDPVYFIPTQFIGSILYYSIHDLQVYIEDNFAYCLFKKGNTQDNARPYYLFRYDLTNINP